jgi:hypothetical protein
MATKGKSENKNKQQTANGSGPKAEKSESNSSHKSDKTQSKAEKSTAKIPKIDSLTKILEGDLTSVDPKTALQQIEEWEAVLKESDDKEFKAIAKDLKQMAKLLENEAAEAEFADLFVELGEGVNDAADSADEEMQEKRAEICWSKASP